MKAAALACLAALVGACRDAAEPAALDGRWPGYTLRGRWPDPRRLRVRIDAEQAPIAAETMRGCIDRALAVWQATGVVGFVTATDTGNADGVDVTLSFRRGHHGACEPFGPGTALAHSGPVARGTFVHFDAARPWDEDSLFCTALHELGHVLGLGHTADAGCVMSNGAIPTRLGRGDLDGIHTLYGGGLEGDGDVRIVAADGTERAVLRGACPRAADLAACDVDGDGAEELLVWNADPVGNGALLIHRFGPGPRPLATLGPFLGVVAAGMEVALVRTGEGAPLLLGRMPNGRMRALAFDRNGAPQACDPRADAEARFAASLARRTPRATAADLDGDGKLETCAAPR